MEFIQSNELLAAGGMVFLSGVLPARDSVPTDALLEAQCNCVFDQREKVNG